VALRSERLSIIPR